MPLSRHISPESILTRLQESRLGGSDSRDRRQSTVAAARVSDRRRANPGDYQAKPIPKFRMAESGINRHEAVEILRNDLNLDGRPNLNLASFVNTTIDDGALSLATENLTKNLADSDEYPALMAIHQRCVSMLGHLWNVPEGHVCVGTATTGSSEAIHLGGLAMKRLWEARQKANGRSTAKPNIIMGANAQVALEKFARYFDVENRFIPVSAESRYCLDVSKVRENLDENTIGVFVILGSTYTGHYEDVAAVSKILDQFEAETGFDVPIHVDGASGAMVAPFLHPDTVWDFRLPRVRSINTSGHKFGLATAGLGWILWKDKDYLPDDLIFILRYLGGEEASYTLNFSRPGYQVIHQYYNFITLGFEGYAKTHGASLSNARLLSNFLESTGYFEVVSDIHRPNGVLGYQGQLDLDTIPLSHDPAYYNPGLPVVSFRFTREYVRDYPEIPQSAVAAMLRLKGYIVPNYPLPEGAEDQEVLRIVVRSTLSVELLDRLMEDIASSAEHLMDAAVKHRGDLKDAAVASEDHKAAYDMLSVISTTSAVVEEHEWLWEGKEKTVDAQHHSAC